MSNPTELWIRAGSGKRLFVGVYDTPEDADAVIEAAAERRHDRTSPGFVKKVRGDE